MARGDSTRLWAPWRMRYIRKAETEKPSAASGCLFCRVRRSRTDKTHLVLVRHPKTLLMLNRFPYNPGHLMVAVNRHAARITDLTADERVEWLELTSLAERALEREYRPHGINFGANVGRVAGAGYPGHLHLHLVPRWNGDTNFMPTIADTKVLPESLSDTWARLRRAIRALEKAPPRRGASRGRTRT